MRSPSHAPLLPAGGRHGAALLLLLALAGGVHAAPRSAVRPVDPAAESKERREQRDREVLVRNLTGLMTLEYRDPVVDPAHVQREMDRLHLDPGLRDHDPRIFARQEWLPLDPRLGKWSTLFGATAGALLRELSPEERRLTLAGQPVPRPTTDFTPRTQDLLFLQASHSRSGRGDGQGGVIWETLAERRERFGKEKVSFTLAPDRGSGTWALRFNFLDEKGRRVAGGGPIGPPLGFSAKPVAKK